MSAEKLHLYPSSKSKLEKFNCLVGNPTSIDQYLATVADLEFSGWVFRINKILFNGKGKCPQ